MKRQAGGSINWTKILKELGLESPGREKAVEEAKLRSEEKKKLK